MRVLRHHHDLEGHLLSKTSELLQAALHLMPVLSFIRAFLYYAARPPPAAADVPSAQDMPPSESHLEAPAAAEAALSGKPWLTYLALLLPDAHS